MLATPTNALVLLRDDEEGVADWDTELGFGGEARAAQLLENLHKNVKVGLLRPTVFNRPHLLCSHEYVNLTVSDEDR